MNKIPGSEVSSFQDSAKDFLDKKDNVPFLKGTSGVFSNEILELIPGLTTKNKKDSTQQLIDSEKVLNLNNQAMEYIQPITKREFDSFFQGVESIKKITKAPSKPFYFLEKSRLMVVHGDGSTNLFDKLPKEKTKKIMKEEYDILSGINNPFNTTTVFEKKLNTLGYENKDMQSYLELEVQYSLDSIAKDVMGNHPANVIDINKLDSNTHQGEAKKEIQNAPIGTFIKIDFEKITNDYQHHTNDRNSYKDYYSYEKEYGLSSNGKLYKLDENTLVFLPYNALFYKNLTNNFKEIEAGIKYKDKDDLYEKIRSNIGNWSTGSEYETSFSEASEIVGETIISPFEDIGLIPQIGKALAKISKEYESITNPLELHSKDLPSQAIIKKI